MAENVGDIEYVIKADTAQLLRADKQVRNVTDGMEGGFNRADKAASSLSSSFGSLSRVATSLMASGNVRAGTNGYLQSGRVSECTETTSQYR